MKATILLKTDFCNLPTTETQKGEKNLWKIRPGADPIKLFFFANENVFCFSGKLLRFLHIEKNSLMVKWPSLTLKKENEEKKFYRIGSRNRSYKTLFLCELRIFPFFAVKLGHFIFTEFILFITNTQA